MTLRSKWLGLLLPALLAQASFAQLIAPTDPLTPEQERLKLRVPEGFEVQLVAAEPDIQKPMNMKFDAAGRLWVTHSIEYPFPAREGEGRDGITILSDFGPDGRARKVQRFAEGLNIPIGIVPVTDGCIVWSIPHIWKLTDTNGDGRADKREVLFTGFEYVDTHGNQNGFTRWVDGWIYACHGFRNDSKIRKGTDGPVVLAMQSGNVYRFKEDGSAIEQWTWGQVNPFGLTFDPLGNIYTADCHSRPITMLIRGAHYQSFGKPHDGLGYAPDMIDHDHGSTAICGIAYYAADHFPEEYRDCLYTGNVMTNAVHRDAIRWTGATPHAVTKEDFIRSEDKWFRPVDVQLGPDGALYVADFYNRIIGHYEVDLHHPGRDRHRGRIWRVVNKTTPQTAPDLASLSLSSLIQKLGDDNLTARTLATNEIIDRFANDAVPELRRVVANSSLPAFQRTHALWALERLDRLETDTIEALIDETSEIVRIHLLRAMSQRPRQQSLEHTTAYLYLKDDRPSVRRAAAESLAIDPGDAAIPELLDAWNATSSNDQVLTHTIRVALREHMKEPAIVEAIGLLGRSDRDKGNLAEIAIAAPNPAAAAFVLDYVTSNEVDRARLRQALPYLARNLPAERVDGLTSLVRERVKDDESFQLTLLRLVREGLAQRGAEPSDAMKSWAAELAGSVLRGESIGWANFPHPDKPSPRSPWGLQERPLAGGGTAVLISSHPRGEPLTGVLRSKAFAIPAKLAFSMCGHNGHPNANPPAANYIRLVLADSGQEIARAQPPRNDTARRYEWDLTDHVGKSGYLEVIDGDTAGAFAWLAVGRFDPSVVNVPQVDPAQAWEQQAEALRLVTAFRLKDHAGRARQLLADSRTDAQVRTAAAEALLAVDPPAAAQVLGAILSDGREPEPVRIVTVEMLARLDSPAARAAMLSALPTGSQSMQLRLAFALGGSIDGAESVLKAVTEGKASARLLQERLIVERLRATGVPDLDGRVAKLTTGLAPADDRLNQLLAERRSGFHRARTDSIRGREVFQRVCAACHQIAGQGNRIGPNLDGVGHRGLDRIVEDIIDPNRNIDAAFRFTTLALKNGQAMAGMPLREEGQTLVLADTTGKEHAFALDQIASRTELRLSLMPPALVESMSEQEFYDLVAYLLDQRPEATK